jgi:hypothetical protein
LALIAVNVAATVDQMELCRDLIQRMFDLSKEPFGLEMEETVQLSARLTAQSVILFSTATLIFIFACAHYPQIEQWWGQTSLYLLLALLLAVLITSAVLLQKAASALRSETIYSYQATMAEALWTKRLLLQGVVDIDCLGWPPVAGWPAFEGDHFTWWYKTLQRLQSRHIPPIKLATLSFREDQIRFALQRLKGAELQGPATAPHADESRGRHRRSKLPSQHSFRHSQIKTPSGLKKL